MPYSQCIKKGEMSKWQLNFLRYHERQPWSLKNVPYHCEEQRARLQGILNLTNNPTIQQAGFFQVWIFIQMVVRPKMVWVICSKIILANNFLFKHDNFHFYCFIIFPSDITANIYTQNNICGNQLFANMLNFTVWNYSFSTDKKNSSKYVLPDKFKWACSFLKHEANKIYGI